LSPDVSIDAIPQAALEQARQGIQAYLAPMIVISPDAPLDRTPVALAGSGTFVELDGRHYVLTADHVWTGTEGWADLAIALVAEGMPLSIPRDRIVPKRLGAPPYTEWGPDLALLEIPPHFVPTIKGTKSFLSLVRRREMLRTNPPRIEKALWAVMGMVQETSGVRPREESGRVPVNIRGEAFFGVTVLEDDRDGYDYLTTHAKTTLPNVPASFKGVSGGGLWEIGLTMKKATGEISWERDHHFRGVAFWEQPKPPHDVALRCHGPRSIFEKAWAAWGLPTTDPAPA
jgi:hypothetical protein